MRQAIKRLVALGFQMGMARIPRWGWITPEFYPVGKDHFTPKTRDVFIGKAKGGYYVTSHLRGTMRRYRCRQVNKDCDIANIFGGGKTLQEAIDQFCTKFEAKIYNTHP